MSGKNGTQISTFNIIRYYGDPKHASVKLTNGATAEVYREEKLFILEMGRFIPCPPYDNHFIYENPDKGKGTAAFMCTCGSPAVIAGMSSYQGDASPQGLMFVCLFFGQFGYHTTKESRWI